MMTSEFLVFLTSVVFIFISIAFGLGCMSGYQQGFDKGYREMRKELSKEKQYNEIKREIITYQVTEAPDGR
ncbi:MAG: hypothetical protein WC455_30815 [Dehalococcoidia bacterium]|jgi:hypothetical protein